MKILLSTLSLMLIMTVLIKILLDEESQWVDDADGITVVPLTSTSSRHSINPLRRQQRGSGISTTPAAAGSAL
jgi:hypothetical protein